MSASLSTNDGGLDALVTLLLEAATAIEGALGTLDSRSELLRGGWSGEAAEAYSTAHAQWTDELRTMNAMLRDARGAARRAALRYSQAESAIASGWRI